MDEQIKLIVKDEIKKLPTNVECKIIHIYPDNIHADIDTVEYGQLKYVKCLNTPTIDQIGVLMFLNNSFDERIVIC